MAQFDPLYKKFFEHPQLVVDLIRQALQSFDGLVQSLDFSTACKVPTELVSESLHRRFVDRTWQVHFTDHHRIAVFILEFQTRTDPHMGLRTINYCTMLLQTLIKNKLYRCGPNQQYPLIMPLVLYNGAAPWSAHLDVHERFIPLPDSLQPYLPSQHYVLVDEKRYVRPLSAAPELFSALVAIMHSDTIDKAIGALRAVDEWLDDVADRELKLAFVEFFLLTSKDKYPDIDIPEDIIMGQWRNVLEDSFDRWEMQARSKGIEEGRQVGIQEGIQEGYLIHARDTLKIQLKLKFGELPETVIASIETADQQQLDEWTKQVLEATELKQMFIS